MPNDASPRFERKLSQANLAGLVTRDCLAKNVLDRKHHPSEPQKVVAEIDKRFLILLIQSE